MHEEIWRDIKGYEGFFQISNKGRVKSLARVDRRGHRVKERILKHHTSRNGYHRVGLNKNGKYPIKYIHRLISEAFIPNPENKPQINHIDGNKLNNKIDNLEWVTSKQNCIHARDNRLSSIAKINMEIASQIREMYYTKMYSHDQLAKLFKLKKTEIGYIINNKRWCV